MFDTKLYFSGSVGLDTSEHLIANDVHRLFTHAYPEEVFEYLDLADARGKRCRIMMDSGAFTSWSIGKPVQLRDLIEYNEKVLRRYGDRHDFVFISLDVIPGERGRKATQEEISAAVVQSYDNFLVMQQHFKNHKVLPVYHSGEDISLRNAYLQKTDYICLSMDQGMSEKNRVEWAKRSIAPGFFHHGLAATGNAMVSRVDWYSVDSSSWVTVGAMGSILWPVGDKFRVLAVSKTSPLRHEAGAHIDTLTPTERAVVVKAIEGWGFDVDTLRDSYQERWRWNIYNWCYPPWKKKHESPMDLFS